MAIAMVNTVDALPVSDSNSAYTGSQMLESSSQSCEPQLHDGPYQPRRRYHTLIFGDVLMDLSTSGSGENMDAVRLWPAAVSSCRRFATVN